MTADSLIVFALLGLLPAVIAHRKGNDFVTWWVYGALIWPVAIVHALLFLKPGVPSRVRLFHGDPGPGRAAAPTFAPRAYEQHAAPPVTRDELRHWFGPR